MLENQHLSKEGKHFKEFSFLQIAILHSIAFL